MIAWWWPILALIVVFGVGYLLFPYITKMRIDDQTKQSNERIDATEWPPGL